MGVRKNGRTGGGHVSPLRAAFSHTPLPNANAGGFPCPADFLREFVTFLVLRTRDEFSKPKAKAPRKLT